MLIKGERIELSTGTSFRTYIYIEFIQQVYRYTIQSVGELHLLQTNCIYYKHKRHLEAYVMTVCAYLKKIINLQFKSIKNQRPTVFNDCNIMAWADNLPQ